MTQSPFRTQQLGIGPEMGKSFMAMLEADLAENGKDIIEYLRKERPYDYVRIVVSLLPNEVPTWRIEDMTDDELAIVLRALIAQQEALQRSEPAEPDDQSSAGSMT